MHSFDPTAVVPAGDAFPQPELLPGRVASMPRLTMAQLPTPLEDAVARANATPYGLSASVWSEDPAAARELASRIDAGTVWLNQHLSVLPMLPTTGLKASGLGAENGPWGLESYLQIQTIAPAA
jgi:acyl-CoA reductase-like NAD-dependent aldehyde dehydrogenase